MPIFWYNEFYSNIFLGGIKTDMKTNLKCETSVLKVLIIVLCLCLCTPFSVFAASKTSMQRTKVKWDLKPKKTYRVKTSYYNVGMQDADITIIHYKKTKNKGNYTVNFDVLFDLTVFNPTNQQIHDIVEGTNYNATSTIGGICECYIVDYDSGKNLDWSFNCNENVWNPWDYPNESYGEMRTNQDVTVKSRLSRDYGNQTYQDDHGCYILIGKQKYHYSITYPASYKGLCIGIGGCSRILSDAKYEKFNYGILPFAKLNDYIEAPKNFHFMKIK